MVYGLCLLAPTSVACSSIDILAGYTQHPAYVPRFDVLEGAEKNAEFYIFHRVDILCNSRSGVVLPGSRVCCGGGSLLDLVYQKKSSGLHRIETRPDLKLQLLHIPAKHHLHRPVLVPRALLAPARPVLKHQDLGSAYGVGA
ncbi:hypothetical protein GQ457_12G020410 [Hibiscus cannabinus]